MCLSSRRPQPWKEPDYIRVHLAQLKGNNYSAPERIRCLVQLVLPDRSRDPSAITQLDWFEFGNPTPLVLDRTLSSLSELTFLFTDHNNEELKLPGGPPTILNCVIEEMGKVDRFTITLNPSLSAHIHGSNTDVDFIVDFGSSIIADSEWEVALHSVIVPSGIYVVGSFFEYKIIPRSGEEKKKRIKNTGQSAKDMLTAIQTDLYAEGIFLQRNDANTYSVYFGEKSSALRFNPSLCKLFNMQHYDSTHGYLFEGSKEEAHKIFPYGAKFEGENRVEYVEQIVLYSDLVQSSVIGNERAPLVDILSTQKLGLLDCDHSTDTLYTVPQLVFRPVSKALIKAVHIKISDIRGHRAEFEYAHKDMEMQFIFVFRK